MFALNGNTESLANCFHTVENEEQRNKGIIAVHSELCRCQKVKDVSTILKVGASSLALLIGIVVLVFLALMVVFASLPVGTIVALSLVAFFTIVPGIGHIVYHSTHSVFSKSFSQDEITQLIKVYDWEKKPLNTEKNTKIVNEVSTKIRYIKISEENRRNEKAFFAIKYKEQDLAEKARKKKTEDSQRAYLEKLKTDDPEKYETVMRYSREAEAARKLDWDEQCRISHSTSRCL